MWISRMISAPRLCSVARLKSSPAGSPRAGSWFCAWIGAMHSADAHSSAVRRTRQRDPGALDLDNNDAPNEQPLAIKGRDETSLAIMPHIRFETVSCHEFAA